jgi:hypothetical protein
MSVTMRIRAYFDQQHDKALLFTVGSCSGYLSTPESDYDLVLLTKCDISAARRNQIERDLAALLEGAFVILVPSCYGPVRRSYTIVIKGCSVYEHDLGERISVEEHLWQRYEAILESAPRHRRRTLSAEMCNTNHSGRSQSSQHPQRSKRPKHRGDSKEHP